MALRYASLRGHPVTSGGTIYTIPSNIDGTGNSDTTQAIQNWIGTVPNGTPSAPNTLQFGLNKTYGYAQGSWLFGKSTDQSAPGANDGSFGAYQVLSRSNLIFDFNNCTFQALNAGTDHRFTWFVSGTNLTFKNGTLNSRGSVVGPPSGGDVEFESPVFIQACSNVTFNNITMKDCYGYFYGIIGSDGSPTATPSTNILITNCLMDTQTSGSNAQGIAIECVNGLTIQNCTMKNPAVNAIDVEPNFLSWVCKNITVSGNTFTGLRGGGVGWFTSANANTSGTNMANWTISGNNVSLLNTSQQIYGVWIDTNASDKVAIPGVSITGNTIAATGSAFFLNGLSNVTVQNNQTSYAINYANPLAVMFASRCTGSVTGNTHTGGWATYGIWDFYNGGAGPTGGTNNLTYSNNTGWPSP